MRTRKVLAGRHILRAYGTPSFCHHYIHGLKSVVTIQTEPLALTQGWKETCRKDSSRNLSPEFSGSLLLIMQLCLWNANSGSLHT